MTITLDRIDRKIIEVTQAGLPLTPRPYHAVAALLDIDPEEIMKRMNRFLEAGVIRRIGAVPNHYAMGYRANGMSVWDVPDEYIDELGGKVGALEFVSHCYHRPRHPPDWPYNLFAMVHGKDRSETEVLVGRIAAVLGEYNRGHEVIYSDRILKKTGMRI